MIFAKVHCLELLDIIKGLVIIIGEEQQGHAITRNKLKDHTMYQYHQQKYIYYVSIESMCFNKFQDLGKKILVFVQLNLPYIY